MPATNSLPAPSPEPAVFGRCLYCGSALEPQVHRYEPDGSARRIWCVDIAACERRQNAEAEWAEQRFAITPAGRQALAVIEQAEQLPLTGVA